MSVLGILICCSVVAAIVLVCHALGDLLGAYANQVLREEFPDDYR